MYEDDPIVLAVAQSTRISSLRAFQGALLAIFGIIVAATWISVEGAAIASTICGIGVAIVIRRNRPHLVVTTHRIVIRNIWRTYELDRESIRMCGEAGVVTLVPKIMATGVVLYGRRRAGIPFAIGIEATSGATAVTLARVRAVLDSQHRAESYRPRLPWRLHRSWRDHPSP